MADNMNATPVASRLHIAIFGRRNAGKSSMINALTNQPAALVSSVPGTTTDPVSKTMELLPIGPVVMIDTAGIDDEGDLGEMRVQKTYEVLNKTDLALLLLDGSSGISEFELSIKQRIQEKNIPLVGVVNKIDLEQPEEQQKAEWEAALDIPLVLVSAQTGEGIEGLKQAIIQKAPKEEQELSLLGGLIHPGETAVLVVPIDKAAPKGRLILPQQQVIRELLDLDAMAFITKEHELRKTLESLREKPAIVITDSQAFLKVDADTPKDIPLTSFSILMARHKGNLQELIRGAKAIDTLNPGDKVLIAEACTHHRQSDDIGTVKIPRWLRQIVGGELEFEWFSGSGFPKELNQYKLIVHCGACMINRREMLHRIETAKQQQVPIVNYGILIAYVQGIFPRAIECFPGAKEIFLQKDA